MDKIMEMAMSKEKTVMRSFFAFNCNEPDEQIVFKFNLWTRRCYPKFFKNDPAKFHDEITLNNLRLYKGDLKLFVNIVFRGAAKTTLTKLFIAYVILNDIGARRKFFKVLTKDRANGAQIVTDIYNMIVTVKHFYPDVFQKTDQKKEERMDSFTTANGIKVRAGTVGQEQRGQIQEDSRPDFIWFDDFETRNSIRSALETQKVWDNMEEAKTGLSKDGGCVYTCNYISERGNVHKLVEKKDNEGVSVLIVPIIEDGVPTWSAFTLADIKRIEQDADDYAGEYLCKPSAGYGVFFDREIVEDLKVKEPIKVSNGFKIFETFIASHRYGCGADVAGGVGLDSSASVWIDFSTVPARVVGTFADNLIEPSVFGHELARQGEMFGSGIIAPENNKFDEVIGVLKTFYKTLYTTEQKSAMVKHMGRRTYGWNTNGLTKPKMLNDLRDAIQDGLLIVNDEALKREIMSYSRDDLMDRDIDPRLTTKHWDLLIACAIAWQMKDHAVVGKAYRPKKILNLKPEHAAYN